MTNEERGQLAGDFKYSLDNINIDSRILDLGDGEFAITFTVKPSAVLSFGDYHIGIYFEKGLIGFYCDLGEKSRIDLQNDSNIYYFILYYLNRVNSSCNYCQGYLDKSIRLSHKICYPDIHISLEDVIEIYEKLLEIYPVYEEGLYNIIYQNADPHEESIVSLTKLSMI
jgi:hypothetical protein